MISSEVHCALMHQSTELQRNFVARHSLNDSDIGWIMKAMAKVICLNVSPA